MALAAASVVDPSPSAAASASSEVGDWTVHHSVFNSTFLQPETAERYGIERAGNRFVLNVSVHSSDGAALEVALSGGMTNLLGQTIQLEFKTIREDKAVYNISTFTADDQELLKFELDISLEETTHTLGFEFKVHHDR